MEPTTLPVCFPMPIQEDAMRCESCGAKNIGTFNGEVAIPFPGLKNITLPNLWIVCLDCGAARFAIAESLHVLQGADAVTAGW